jgi:multimeric flavodoxin WrbA
MSLKILGVSGSPVPNSNTDRAVKAVLEASGLESEFVKLSDIIVRPCRACKRCVEDNICKQEDDFPALAKKLREA